MHGWHEGPRLQTFEELLESIRANAVAQVLLPSRSLDQDEVQSLADALHANKSVKRLQSTEALSDDDDGRKLRLLASALETSAVTELDLSFNKVEPEGVLWLAMCLRSSQVHSLQLSENAFGAAGAMALAQVLAEWPLGDLSIWHNDLTDEGLMALAAALPLSSLTALDLMDHSLSEAGVGALAAALPSSKLVRLVLENSQIGDAGTKLVAGALKESHLEYLDLGINAMHDEGAEALAAHLPGSPLTCLNLSNNRIADAGARALAAVLKDSNLEKVFLDGNDVGEEGYEAFLVGVEDTAVTDLTLQGDGHAGYIEEEVQLSARQSELLQQIQEVLDGNKARSLVLQIHIEGDPTRWTLSFRTIAGSEACTLIWSSDRPAEDLPKAVFEAMGSAGFSRHLRAHNLRLLRPDGRLLEVGSEAPDLLRQLG